MPADVDLTSPATTSGLHAALQSISEACRTASIDDDLAFRARIVVEELFTNAIKYGYGGECDRPVRIRLAMGTVLTLIYEDDAPPFDPTVWRGAAQRPDQRPEGQAGIDMVVGLSSSVKYAQVAGGNRLTIILEPRRPHEPRQEK
jgi:serine/threonine-protein kinase RsbW